MTVRTATPLKVKCPKCGEIYLVRGDILPPAGVKLSCKKCGYVIHVMPPASQADSAGAERKQDAYERLYGGPAAKKPK